MKSILMSASLPLLAAVANAQFLEIQKLTVDASGRKTPVIADIILQTTSITPWDTYTQILKGKFWRSRDGKNRQDDSFGTSFLLNPKARTWVDRELQTAVVDTSTLPRVLSQFSWGAGTTSLGKGILVGRAVSGWRNVVPFGDGEFQIDVWTDIRLGIPIQIRQKSRTTEIVQQLNNIEERDPDPKLFEIPEGFSVVSCAPAASRGKKQPSNRPALCGTGPSNSR
jgi:hypothetical protein